MVRGVAKGKAQSNLAQCFCCAGVVCGKPASFSHARAGEVFLASEIVGIVTALNIFYLKIY